MNQTELRLASIAMDLKRVALGLHRNSDLMAKRFSTEAIKRSKEVDMKNIKPYIQKLLKGLEPLLSNKDKQKVAEDALMYSTLLQNSVTKQS